MVCCFAVVENEPFCAEWTISNVHKCDAAFNVPRIPADALIASASAFRTNSRKANVLVRDVVSAGYATGLGPSFGQGAFMAKAKANVTNFVIW